MDTPDDYFVEFMAAANATLAKECRQIMQFFAEVWAITERFC